MSDSKRLPVAFLMTGDIFYGTDGPELEDWDIQYDMEACEALAKDFPDQQIPLYADTKEAAALIEVAPELLSIARRWAAIDAQWHPDRYESEKAELLINTKAAIAKATA